MVSIILFIVLYNALLFYRNQSRNWENYTKVEVRMQWKELTDKKKKILLNKHFESAQSISKDCFGQINRWIDPIFL